MVEITETQSTGPITASSAEVTLNSGYCWASTAFVQDLELL